MSFNKIKEMLRDKKVKVGIVAGVSLLALAAAGIAVHNNKIKNEKIVLEAKEKEKLEKDRAELDREMEQDNLILDDNKEKIENLKDKLDENLSKDDKKEVEEEIKKLEEKNRKIETKTIENKKEKERIEKKVEDTSKKSNSNKVSVNNVSKENNENKVNIVQKPVEESKPNKESNETKEEHKHEHKWIPITEIVHHKEQGHYENVLVKPAWTEEVPIYEEKTRDICNTCNADLTGTNIAAHVKKHMMAGEDMGGHRTEVKTVKVGNKTVKHKAVYKKKWIVDKKAYDEKIVRGYKCSGCGANK